MFALQATVTGPTGQVLAQGQVGTPNADASVLQALCANLMEVTINSLQLTDGTKVHVIGEALTSNSVVTLEIIEL